MANFNIPNEGLDIIVDALKTWIQNYEARGFGAEHVIIAASMIIGFNKTAAEILDRDPEEKDKEDETLTRNPNPGERFIYGKQGYQKS